MRQHAGFDYLTQSMQECGHCIVYHPPTSIHEWLSSSSHVCNTKGRVYSRTLVDFSLYRCKLSRSGCGAPSLMPLRRRTRTSLSRWVHAEHSHITYIAVNAALVDMSIPCCKSYSLRSICSLHLTCNECRSCQCTDLLAVTRLQDMVLYDADLDIDELGPAFREHSEKANSDTPATAQQPGTSGWYRMRATVALVLAHAHRMLLSIW